MFCANIGDSDPLSLLLVMTLCNVVPFATGLVAWRFPSLKTLNLAKRDFRDD